MVILWADNFPENGEKNEEEEKSGAGSRGDDVSCVLVWSMCIGFARLRPESAAAIELIRMFVAFVRDQEEILNLRK